jgi:hypothetical protein
MSQHITELDKAEIRHEAREIYKEDGWEGLLDFLEEVLITGEAILEVTKEEYIKTNEHRQSH